MTGVAAPDLAVQLVREQGVGVVTLRRAGAMNAVDDAIRAGLVDACGRASADPEIRAIVIRAEGERAFCVGADIKEEREPLSQVEARFPAAALDYTAAIAASAKPTVAAIHGYCLGAGLEIALSCDIRVAAAGASFGLPEVGLGLIPGAGGTQRLPRLVGIGRALDMMLTGERIDAPRALAYGLVTRIFDDRAALDEGAFALARKLAAQPPLAIAYLKEAVAAGLDGSLSAGLGRERDLFTLLSATEDRREATEAFMAKRPGIFRGR